MPELEFEEVIDLICKEDGRYEKKAYDFVRHGLDHTVKELRKKNPKQEGRSFHVSGPELLEGMRVYALDQYGPMAITVLKAWGIKRCKDFGAIVFNLIDYKVFSKTENDRREDFSEIYSFKDAFVKPFLPTGKSSPATKTASVSGDAK